MTGEFDAEAFSSFEVAGWERQAEPYHDFFAPITTRVAEPLLEAAAVDRDDRVLDVGTGPGYVAAAAAARGASTVGVDVAEAMVEMARAAHPAVDFRRADAERLPMADGTFDAVVGNFAVLHLPRPERAVAEFRRVLSPGGSVALSTWDAPERCRLAGVFVDAVARVGAPPPPEVPPGPSFFHFADEETFRGLLTAAGLTDVTVRTIGFTHDLTGPDALWHGLLGGTVRSRTLVFGQPPAVRRDIRAAFDELVGAYRTDDGLAIPVSVKIASARRPTS